MTGVVLDGLAREIDMRRMLWGLIGILLWVGPVLAQTYEEHPPQGLGDKSTTIEWLIATGFLIGCLVVAFKPAKRANIK